MFFQIEGPVKQKLHKMKYQEKSNILRNNVTKNKCMYCRKRIWNFDDLLEHNCVEGIRKCPICSTDSRNRSDYKEHLSTVHELKINEKLEQSSEVAKNIHENERVNLSDDQEIQDNTHSLGWRKLFYFYFILF